MKLYIKRLKVHCLIGVHPWEQAQKQALYLNVECSLDSAKTAYRDHIDDTLDYQQVADQISSLIENSHFQLIESVARCIAEYLQSTHSIKQGCVEVIKPQALAKADSVGVIFSW